MEFESKGLISLEIEGEVYGYKLYESLDSLTKTKSQRKSAKELNISHTVFNRRILRAEKKLGFKLTEKLGNGTELTKEGLDLLEEFKKYAIQIEKTPTINIVGGHISTGLLESIELPFKTNIYSSNDEDAFELAKRGVVDILTLDDPLIAFERDINFYPIAYDYLVLISSPDSEKIESISDLENLDFVSVSGSAQRLAWNSLKHYDIHVNIKENVSSQFDAYKKVRNSKNLHTFLNASYFKGNELLKFNTQHVISLIKVNEDKAKVDEFIKYLTNEAQESIEKQGFTPM
ncbi:MULTISPECIES: LysR family transcriptional regulator [Methanobrevibacter]|uniref:DNA-binding transcriptional LysR family regulator n=1 Tax=Methanobrevibacter gottschalkii DSM 11977 TaxID=1122229 RepID=A0A3N5B778_9EURY|nr:MULTISPECIES: LysR family transcriptional regulator [Methanobrevibacter]OEC95862.1 LysR family transcriptional regulator [Methanobrevibacter sp. A27]RPF52949.1 DNA-binding transcriptional LysR family regulator [Methanobrevibacter gottschalkii DSM 11977]